MTMTTPLTAELLWNRLDAMSFLCSVMRHIQAHDENLVDENNLIAYNIADSCFRALAQEDRLEEAFYGDFDGFNYHR